VEMEQRWVLLKWDRRWYGENIRICNFGRPFFVQWNNIVQMTTPRAMVFERWFHFTVWHFLPVISKSFASKLLNDANLTYTNYGLSSIHEHQPAQPFFPQHSALTNSYRKAVGWLL